MDRDPTVFLGVMSSPRDALHPLKTGQMNRATLSAEGNEALVTPFCNIGIVTFDYFDYPFDYPLKFRSSGSRKGFRILGSQVVK